jgi:hypothetical protein
VSPARVEETQPVRSGGSIVSEIPSKPSLRLRAWPPWGSKKHPRELLDVVKVCDLQSKRKETLVSSKTVMWVLASRPASPVNFHLLSVRSPAPGSEVSSDRTPDRVSRQISFAPPPPSGQSGHVGHVTGVANRAWMSCGPTTVPWPISP